MMKLRLILCWVLCLAFFASCSKSELGESSSNTIRFVVSNYKQYSFEELTRSAVASDLDHLAFAVFDEASGKTILPQQIQDRGSEGYGVFSISLPEGKYRVVFLGYDKNYKCSITSADRIMFENDYVPNMFLYSAPLVVDSSTPSQQNIVLKRVVSGFRLIIEDELPSGVVSIRFAANAGSSVLNALTGFSSSSNGRTSSVSIPADYVGYKGTTLIVYLFLPSESCPVDYTVEALNAKGEVVKSRLFQDVPMKVNVISCYSGNFFSESAPTSDMSFPIKIEKDWDAENKYTY